MEQIGIELSERGTKKSTVLTYLRIAARLNNNKPFTNLDFLLDTKKIIATIDKYKISTQSSYYAAIRSLLNTQTANNKKFDTAREKYKSLFNLLNTIRIKENQLGERTERQANCWMDWSAIEKKRDALLEKDGSAPSKDALILSLYTIHPPRRNLDYLRMKLGPVDKLYNSYDGANFTFKDYKTSDTYGTQTLPLDPKLKKIIDDYIKTNKLKDGDFLLYNGSPFDGYKINRSLKRSLGKTIGSSMLRHIYLTDKYANTLDKMKTDADAMAHSTGMQREYVLS